MALNAYIHFNFEMFGYTHAGERFQNENTLFVFTEIILNAKYAMRIRARRVR